MYCLLEIVAVASEYFAAQFTKDVDWIKVRLLLLLFSCVGNRLLHLKVKGLDIYILPLTGRPEQQQFTI